MVLTLSPLSAVLAQGREEVRTVLLFGVSDESSSGMPRLDKITTDALQMAIDSVRGLECTEFSRTSPLVRRASAEGRVLPTQMETGPTNVADAIAVGQVLGVDTVVLASIQSYRSAQMPRSVEMILSGRAYDVAPNYDAEAGAPVDKPMVAQAFGVVGTSRTLPGYKGSDRPLAREAVDDAAYRVAKVLSGASISEVAKPKLAKKKKNKTAKMLAYLAALGLVAWLVSDSGGDGDGGPHADAVPPTPLPLQLEGTDTIRVRWEPPTGITVPVLRYRLQRSVNGGAWSYFGLGSSSANIPATSTEFPDSSVSAGNTYKYRISVIYQNSHVSRWVEFNGVSL